VAISIGKYVRGRILTMNGLFASTTPRNDGSAGVGQWDVAVRTNTFRKHTAATTSNVKPRN